jgi:hypothetical protein
MPRPGDRAYIEQHLDSKSLDQLQKLVEVSGRVADAKDRVVILPYTHWMLSFTLCEEFETKDKAAPAFATEKHSKDTSRFALAFIARASAAWSSLCSNFNG